MRSVTAGTDSQNRAIDISPVDVLRNLSAPGVCGVYVKMGYCSDLHSIDDGDVCQKSAPPPMKGR